MKIEIVFLLGIVLILNNQGVDSYKPPPPFYLCGNACETLSELRNDECNENKDQSDIVREPNCKCQLVENLWLTFCINETIIYPIGGPVPIPITETDDLGPIPETQSTNLDDTPKPTEHSARKGPHSKNGSRRHPKHFKNQHLNKKN